MAAFALAVPSGAQAQGWLADRSRAQGPGIRLGDFELHPGVGVEVGWDSNVYYTEDNPPAGAPYHRVDSGILRVTPHLYFSTLTAQRQQEGEGGQGADTHSEPPTVEFQGGISAGYYEFFADPNRRNLALDVGLRLTVLPQRPFGFSVYDTFSRGIRPFTENVGNHNMAMDTNTAGVLFNFQTDGGVLRVGAGYEFGLAIFEDGGFQYGNFFNHTANLQESFRFLPSTALVSDFQFRYRDYYDYSSALRTSASTVPVQLSNNSQFRVRVGLNGAITTNVSLSGMIGYAAGFFDSRPATATVYVQNYDAPVGQLELRWQILQNTRLSIGYDRDFQASWLGNYYSRDRGYVAFSTMIDGSFLLGIDADVGYVDYGIVLAPDGSLAGNRPSREDIRVTAAAFAEYRFTDWLGINTTIRYQGAFTDYQYNLMTSMGGTPLLDPAGYNKFEAFLGVRVFY